MELNTKITKTEEELHRERLFKTEPNLRDVYARPEAYESADINNFMEFFPEEDYLIKRYDITTPDGYILGLFRIQNHREHKGVIIRWFNFFRGSLRTKLRCYCFTEEATTS